jgi:putative ABC transport system permease protein
VTGIHLTLGEVAASLVLVIVAAGVSFWRKADLEKDLGIAVLRSFLQLTAMGYVIQAIFDTDSIWVVLALLTAMVAFGAFTVTRRAKEIPGVWVPATVGLSLAAAGTLGLVLVLGVFPATPRYLVPVGGMVIGNAMNAASVALNRLVDEVHGSARLIEAALALGATARQASAGLVSRSLRSAMIPIIDQTKNTGVVFFPGTMVGMLLAGANPIDAVRLQLILLWSLMGAVALAAMIGTALGYRGFFTPAHQLREPGLAYE